MSKKLNFSSKKRDNNKKKLVFFISILMVSFLGINGASYTFKYVEDKKQEKIKMQQEAKAKMLEEQKKKKAEEEAKKRIIGVKNEFKEHTFDAKIVEEKLKNNDFSNNGEKVVFLTFDDGTSTTVTPKILDILKENEIYATFFVTGSNIERGKEESKEILKRTLDEGHAIANHSYSHDYKYLYPNRFVNLDNFKADFKKTDDMLKEILGPYFSTRVVRIPGGSMSWKDMDILDSYFDEANIASIDWNAVNADSEGKKKNAEELLQSAIETSQGKEMVVLLMHDTYGKEETVKALDDIIKYYKDNGYVFKTLS